MSASENDIQQDAETVEHLLAIVVENREKRCAQVRDRAREEANAIIRQAHERSRAHMHKHITALREKYRLRLSSAIARNQTRLRQQHQKVDRTILDIAWPLLRAALIALWEDPPARGQWLQAAMASAAERLRQTAARVEHPSGLSQDEIAELKQQYADSFGSVPIFQARDDIEAGLRIRADGTVIDATLEGLLQQRASIEAMIIARVKRGVFGDG
jgi:F0F1-type ATP synthase delta subunit